MKKTLFNLVIISLLLAGFSVGLTASAANIFDQTIGNYQKATEKIYGQGTEAEFSTFRMGLINIINYLLSFLGIVFFLLILYAGWLWMSAQGKEEEIKKAKDIMKGAVIGLVIILSARLITEFIIIQFGQALVKKQ